MEPGIVQYYEQRNGNPFGIPIVHIGINLQPDQDAQTDNFIRQAGFKIVANDYGRVLASRFQSSGQPIFVIINGVANSPSHKQWELLVNQNGYGTTQHPIESFRAAIDQVKVPLAPPPLEASSAPSITAQPQSQTTVAGASVTFSVVAGGTAPLGFQWRFNGADIPGATNATLTLTNVQAASAGEYRVVVANALGSATSVSATLTVIVPPAITVQPQNQTAIVGTDVAFSVSALGTPPLTYQWTFNGIDLFGANSSRLLLTNVQPDLVGSYTVAVRNVAGSVTSRAATLAVIVPVSITAQPQAQKVVAGTTVTFTASVTGTVPILFEWRKDGQPIAGATNATLVLGNVTPTQSGEYSVQVSNAVNSVSSQAATLTVFLPPARRPTLSGFRRFDDGAVEFTLNAETGHTYRIEASSNFIDWALVTQITATDFNHSIRDPAAVTFPHRFYRAVTP